MFDERGAAEALRRRETDEGWIAWLRRMSWSYYADGTFQQPVTTATALTVVTNWLAAYPSAYAAVGVQRGPAHDKYHVHMLVGGIPRTAEIESTLRGAWIKRGHLRIDRYHHLQGGVEYLVRQAEEIEVIGEPKLHAVR